MIIMLLISNIKKSKVQIKKMILNIPEPFLNHASPQNIRPETPQKKTPRKIT